MIRFILKKLFYGLLVMLGVVTLVFFLFSLRPNNAARAIMANHADEQMIKEIEHRNKLDLPVFEQYLVYLNDLSPISIHNPTVVNSSIYLDTAEYSATELISFSDNRVLVIKYPYLRRSFISEQKVSEIIEEALPGTVVLALTAVSIAAFLGILLGILSAVYKGSFLDSGSLVLAVIGMSSPSYFAGLIIAWIGGSVWREDTNLPMLPIYIMIIGILIGMFLNKRLNKNPFGQFSWNFLFQNLFKWFSIGVLIWFVGYGINGLFTDPVIPMIGDYMHLPGTGLSNIGSLYESDDMGNEYLALQNLILPAITLGMRPLAVVLQLTRSSMLEVMSQDYIRTARAKGLSSFSVTVKHALQNALNPVITAVSGWFASLLAGAVFVENIFNWKGLGSEIVEAIKKEDFPVVIGAALLIAAFFVIINMVVDIVYGIIDPRIRLTSK